MALGGFMRYKCVAIEMFTGDSGDTAEDHTFWRKHMESELEFNRDLRKEFKLLECQSLYEDRSTRNYHQEKYFLQPISVFFEIFCQLRHSETRFLNPGLVYVYIFSLFMHPE